MNSTALDLNCEVTYHEPFFNPKEADEIFEYLSGFEALVTLQKIELATGEFFTLPTGKIIFSDQDLIDSNKFPENIWGKSLAWSPLMLKIKNKVEQLSGHEFQVCVCIYYPDGESHVAYHADKFSYGDTSVIPSLSFGAERLFQLKENATQKVHEMSLAHGSMVLMGKHCQDRYEHAVPIDPSCTEPRINLTFRKVGN
jgi:hypothetical protein